ncbi:MAG: hypothetical protein PVJ20_09480 [Desulfobacterales bacterium]|jgi:hypothetical protein
MPEYMVLYIHVDTGEIEEVYEADQLPDDLHIAPEVDHKKGKPFNIVNFVSDKSYATFYTTSSPG